MIDVGDDVSDSRNLSFNSRSSMLKVSTYRRTLFPLGVLRNTISDLPCEIQSSTILLQDIDDPETLLIMIEPTWGLTLLVLVHQHDQTESAQDHAPMRSLLLILHSVVIPWQLSSLFAIPQVCV